MVRTINLTTEVPSDRKVLINLPDDVPAGMADIVVVVAPHASRRGPTLGELAHSEFFGMWAQRSDIGDSAEFSHTLRKEAWDRSL